MVSISYAHLYKVRVNFYIFLTGIVMNPTIMPLNPSTAATCVTPYITKFQVKFVTSIISTVRNWIRLMCCGTPSSFLIGLAHSAQRLSHSLLANINSLRDQQPYIILQPYMGPTFIKQSSEIYHKNVCHAVVIRRILN